MVNCDEICDWLEDHIEEYISADGEYTVDIYELKKDLKRSFPSHP